MTSYDMDGKVIEPFIMETDRRFWSVPVIITSNVWESGYHIYEADSAEAALDMYESETVVPHDIEYTGWMDQEYRFDELEYEGDSDEVEELASDLEVVQTILKSEKERAEWLAEQEKKNES